MHGSPPSLIRRLFRSLPASAARRAVGARGAPGLLCLLSLLFAAATASAQVAPEEAAVLGSVSFPNSGVPEAQEPFIRGVLLLHSFEYDDAASAFREAQKVDPDFALAYWGEAMTYNHPIWMEQDRTAGLEALRRFAETPQERLRRAPTEPERDWLRSVHVLYGVGQAARELGVAPGPGESPAPKEARDDAYRSFMERMHERYPDDDEFAAFYALSVLGTAHEGRDFATYMRAAAVAQEVFRKNPDHPGAAHYVIHSFDDPVHAPLGLRAARAYSEIAPGAAHAQHMTSHIFVALGMWDDVVVANERARDVQNQGEREAGRPPVVCGHYTFWLEYGYLQQGRHDDAREVLARCQRRIDEESPTRGELAYYVDMRARYLLDTEAWGELERWTANLEGAPPGLRARDAWLRGFAAVRRGEPDKARRHLHRMEETMARARASGELPILADELRGALALEEGRTDESLALLESAAEAEVALPFAFGPPAIEKPTLELLGEALLRAGKSDQAAEAFTRALARTPRRTASLLGLARAQEEAGRTAEAERTYAELASIWSRSDAGLEVVREVKRRASEGREKP